MGNRLRTLAQIVKMGLGLRVAAVDMGGWDTHKYQGDGTEGYFSILLGQLSQALAAFDEDMTGRRVTVLVMTEILKKRLGDARADVFPGFSGGAPLGLAATG